MLTLVISALAGLAVFAGATALFDKVSGLVLGPIVGIVTLVLLFRKSRKRLEKAMGEIEGHMRGQRLDRAVEELEKLRSLQRWQPGLGGSIDGQIGMIRYAHQRDFEGARPHLERAHPKLWQAWAMLGAAHFKKDRFSEMTDVFERALKRNKNESLLWLSYAYCEWRRNRRDEVIKILARAKVACPKDERIKHQLENVQNGKKMKMNLHDPEWLALHLDKNLPGGAAANAKPRFMPPAKRLGVRYIRS